MLAAEPEAPVKTSLLAATAAARKGVPKETEDQKRLKEEQEMLHNITNRTALKTFAELAKASSLHHVHECHVKAVGCHHAWLT